uniref:Uncharacterized protein n=1 Tax=Aegilops tauschii subsp. strangulata TaxID=200361 RepID=A0A453JRQ0_AEGTS
MVVNKGWSPRSMPRSSLSTCTVYSTRFLASVLGKPFLACLRFKPVKDPN